MNIERAMPEERLVIRAVAPGGPSLRITLRASGEVEVEAPAGAGKARRLRILRVEPGGLLVVLWGEEVFAGIARAEGERVLLQHGACRVEATLKPESIDRFEQSVAQAGTASGRFEIRSPIPGTIKSLKVKAGDAVREGQTLLVLEAMKMENEIVAPHAGTVEQLGVVEGQTVGNQALLAALRI